MPDKSSYEALIEALSRPEERDDAIRQLGELGDARAVDALGKVLKHTSGDAFAYQSRKLAARVLGEIGNADAVQYLSAGLDDPHNGVKTACVRALGKVGTAEAVEVLVPLLEADNATTREVTVHALGMLGTEHAIPLDALLERLADSQDVVRHATHEAVLMMGGRAFDGLLAGLEHADSTVRGAVADLLAELGDTRAVQPLQDRLLKEDSRWVRSRVERAVKVISGENGEEIADDDIPEGSIPAPRRTLDSLREGKPAWPGMDEGKQPVPMNEAETMDADNMSADDIRALLDTLDMRLINGEISEATYQLIYERWQRRLEERE